MLTNDAKANKKKNKSRGIVRNKEFSNLVEEKFGFRGREYKNHINSIKTP